MAKGTCGSCPAKAHAEGLCWRHLVAVRQSRGDLCGVEGCGEGRFYRGMCGPHATAASKAEHGRRDPVYSVTCEWCGRDAEVQKPGARFCSSLCAKRQHGQERSEAARRSRLPVLHPNPDPLTWLPVRHPAVTPRRHAPLPGRMFVSGPCAWCEESFTALASDWERRSVYCSKRCGQSASEARRGRFKPTPAVRAAVYERDGWICQLCHEPVDPDLDPLDNWAASLDHIVCQSWTLVPDHRPENLRLAHRWCNSVRGDETYYPGEVLAA